jgi:hypothetical protein
MRRGRHVLLAALLPLIGVGAVGLPGPATGAVPQLRPVTVRAGQTFNTVKVALTRAGTISGKVKASTGGSPLRAEVYLLDSAGTQLATTFSNKTTGAYTFKGLLAKSPATTSASRESARPTARRQPATSASATPASRGWRRRPATCRPGPRR